MDSLKVLTSRQDASVNFVVTDSRGTFEARYVRRNSEYVSGYLSSQVGCRQACRFCHLTQTRQTSETCASSADFSHQAGQIVAHYQGLPATLKTADTVHWNFMARGEPFDNLDVLGKADDILDILRLKGDLVGLRSRFKISTIGPSNLQGVEFSDLFRKHTPDLYYSLYSMSEKFRRRWLPKAIDPKLMLRKLVSWQQQTMKLVKLHWCFIAGQNDRTQDIVDIADAVNDVGLRADINIVRYNPFSAAQGEESSESTILACVDILRKILPGSRIKVVSRVGFDVHASCGMFVDNPINI